MFKLSRKYTANAEKLAHKLWDFLNYVVGKKMDTRYHDKTIEKWSLVWDSFLRENDFDHVCEVFDFYVAEWKTKHGYIYLTPDSFIGDFPLIEQRFSWQSRPIPEEELRQILMPLSRERWDCEWDQLVTAVSKSVYSLALFMRALQKAHLPDELKLRIRFQYIHIFEYVTKYFLAWRKHQIEAVWVATITIPMLLKEARHSLSKLGYPDQVISRSVRILDKVIKEVSNDYSWN